MKTLAIITCLLLAAECSTTASETPAESPRSEDVANKYASEGYTLVWADEFDRDGKPDPAKWDYEIDALYVKVRDTLLKIISKNPDLIEDATTLLLVNKHLERIGDYVCNICESIIYMVDAKREHLN